MKTVYLHIGTEKTGTTTLQRFFSVNKDALLKMGYYYPNEKGNNHTFLATYAAENIEKVKDLLIYQNIKDNISHEGFRKEIESYLTRIVTNRKKKKENIVFSNEHISARLQTIKEIITLKKLFDQFDFDTKIIIYLRRQDEYLISLFNTYIQTGGTDKLLTFKDQNKEAYRFKYYKLLKLWSDVFGRSNINVRVFEKDAFVNKDIIHDFLHTIGIDDVQGFVIPNDQNKSLDAKSIEFLRNLNYQMPHFVGDTINTERQDLIKQLEKLPFTEKIPTNLVSIKAFYDSFTISNSKVASDFLGKSTLFSKQETKKLLPDEVLEEKNDIHQAFYVFSALWKLNTNAKEKSKFSELTKRLPAYTKARNPFGLLKRNKSKNIFFITGLSGTGKSALYYYFLENPIKGFAFYDYDESRVKQIDYNDLDSFRIQQYHWWMDIARKTVEEKKLTPVIFGLSLRPLNILINPFNDFFSFKDHHFGLLTCENQERENRLKNRGQEKLFDGHLEWHDMYLEDIRNHCEFEIDTTNRSIEQVGFAVKEFILKIK